MQTYISREKYRAKTCDFEKLQSKSEEKKIPVYEDT